MDLELEIVNYFQFDPRLASCGQPRPEQFSALASAGFVSVINLATSASSGHLPEEPRLWAALGVEFTWLPVVWDAPQTQDYHAFEAWLARNRPSTVLVHCAKNWRASVFCCIYRIRRENVPPRRAWGDVLEVWEPDEVWTDFTRLLLGEKSPV